MKTKISSVIMFVEKVVEPIQSKNKSYYYHRRFRRVPTVDECEVGEQTCLYEANEQFKRDKWVLNFSVKRMWLKQVCYSVIV